MGTTPQPPRPPAPPPPPQSSSSVVVIVLLVLGFIVVFSCFGLWIGFRILSRGVHVQVNDKGGSQKEVTIKTPFGGIEVNKQVNAASLGLPLYPDAKTLSDHDNATINMQWGSEAGLRLVVAKYQTPDAFDKVKEFYQDRLTAEVGKFTPENIEIHTEHDWNGEEGNFIGTDKEGKTVFEIKRKGYMRIVALKSEWDGTRIDLVNIRHGKVETN